MLRGARAGTAVSLQESAIIFYFVLYAREGGISDFGANAPRPKVGKNSKEQLERFFARESLIIFSVFFVIAARVRVLPPPTAKGRGDLERSLSGAYF
jgi:hypothetical protein